MNNISSIFILSIFCVPLNIYAGIISTDVSAGLAIEYRDRFGNWVVDASDSTSGETYASVDIYGAVTSIGMTSVVEAVINTEKNVSAFFNMERIGFGNQTIDTGGFPDPVWGNNFHFSYYANEDSILTYSWDIDAPGMPVTAFNVALADILIDTDFDAANGLLQRIQSANNPGTYTGFSEIELLAGGSYDFVVSMYHRHSFTPNYDISSQMTGKFDFDFQTASVPEPSVFALMFTGLIGLGLARRKYGAEL